jgi:hypothetical protein
MMHTEMAVRRGVAGAIVGRWAAGGVWWWWPDGARRRARRRGVVEWRKGNGARGRVPVSSGLGGRGSKGGAAHASSTARGLARGEGCSPSGARRHRRGQVDGHGGSRVDPESGKGAGIAHNAHSRPLPAFGRMRRRHADDRPDVTHSRLLEREEGPLPVATERACGCAPGSPSSTRQGLPPRTLADERTAARASLQRRPGHRAARHRQIRACRKRHDRPSRDPWRHPSPASCPDSYL